MPASITPANLAARLAAGRPVYLLDVRLPWEHETAALPGTAAVVPVHDLPRRWRELRPTEGATVVAYCHHGVRSWSAATFLELAAGWPEVLSLAGGIDAWSREVDLGVPRY